MLNRAAVQGRYTLIPDRETATVRLKEGEKLFQEITVTDCWRKPTKMSRLLSAGLSIVGNETTWHWDPAYRVWATRKAATL